MTARHHRFHCYTWGVVVGLVVLTYSCISPTYTRKIPTMSSATLTPTGQVIENYSGSLDEIVFTDLKPIELKVKIEDDRYVLVEASGAAACEWQNSLLRGTRLGPDGRPESLDGMADAEPKLVSLCLFKVDGDRRLPVALSTIKGWPGRVQRLLYKKAREISQLDDEDTEESLTKRITELQGKLDKVKSTHTNGQVPTSSGSLDQAVGNGSVAKN